MERAEKQIEVEALEGQISRAQIALCADYLGLTVAEITTFRKKLREGGLKGKVVKNTLATLAFKHAFKDADSADLAKFEALFKGPNFMIFSEHDPVTPAKVAWEFAKDHNKFQVKGAWFENTFLDKQAVEELSKLPSREEILARLLSLMTAPSVQLLRLMKEPAAQLVRVLAAYRDKLEGDK